MLINTGKLYIYMNNISVKSCNIGTMFYYNNFVYLYTVLWLTPLAATFLTAARLAPLLLKIESAGTSAASF